MVTIRRLRDGARRLPPAAPFLSSNRHGDERTRTEARPDRAQYKTAAWQRLRWEILVRDDFICAICGAEHALTPGCRDLKAIGREDLVKGSAPDRVADHKVPHRGDTALFWDRENLQCLCKRCHDAAKQREERARYG